MRRETVTCDGCGFDLSVRTNSVDYRLVLDSEGKPGHGAGFYTDMLVYPPVARSFHFCGLECLDRWRARELYRSTLSRDWWDRWKSDNGTMIDGVIRSYPLPKDDERKVREAEFEAAALAAFPMTRSAITR